MKTAITIAGLTLGTLALFVLLTPLGIFFGWVTGLIVQFFCGQFVADGLNLLFGTNRFTPDAIPLIGGALGFVGAFFKTTTSTSSKS